jgi:hypothetical protein
MTVALRKAGVTKDVTGISIHKGGVLKTVTEGWIRAGGTLLQFFSTISISLDKIDLLGRSNSAGTTTVTSDAVTATPNGAIGTVTHLWTRTAPDAHSWTINNPTGATTTFSTLAGPNEDWLATFEDTITDSAGQTVTSTTVSVDCANVYFGGAGGGPFP